MNDDRVVLLHGLARRARSMAPLARALARDGYTVRNVGYPSTRAAVPALAERAVGTGLAGWPAAGAGRVHFVTHSLGGILLRHYLADHAVERLGRVVMLAAPNHGSEIADTLSDWWFYRWFNGPTGQQLGTGPEGIAARLGPARFELGVIAGDAARDPVLSRLIPAPSDGKVSVASTRLAGMRDHITLPLTHTFIMRAPEAIRQTRHFLAHGRFDHAGVPVRPKARSRKA